MLCEICQNIVFQKPSELRLNGITSIEDWTQNEHAMLHIHQPSGRALRLSADGGCHVCAMFFGLLFANGEPPRDSKGGPPVVLFRDWPLEWKAVTSHFLLIGELIRVRCGKHESFVSGSSPLPDGPLRDVLIRACTLPPSSQLVEGRSPMPVDSFTGSQENLEFAKIILQNCLSTHHKCGCSASPHRPPLLPTRVIDLEGGNGPMLRETHGLRSEYLTLSYCWGSAKRLLAERKSGYYEEFLQAIPVNDRMPKTFKDAFEVTVALGYRYLWIDALCIIQDDPDDLQTEMAQMGDIYRNSALTISAASGPDTSSGLFVERDARWSKPCEVTITMKEGNECLTGIVSISRSAMEYDNPLSKRGWVLQEEVLSTRCLTFGPHEIHWRCMTEQLKESDPNSQAQLRYSLQVLFGPHLRLPAYDYDEKDEEQDGLREVDSLDAVRWLVKNPDKFSHLYRRSNRRRNHFDVWYELVEAYHHRALTVLSDKLPAIAGLATLMQQNFSCTYGAGLWKEDPQLGLAWYVVGSNGYNSIDNSHIEHPKDQDYLAPSWSWASATQRHIRFSDYEANGRCLLKYGLEVLDWKFSYPPGALAPFGQVNSGVLTVKGFLRKLLLIPCEQDWAFNTPQCRHSDTLWKAYAVDPLSGAAFGDVALDSLDAYQSLWDRYQGIRQPKYGRPIYLSSYKPQAGDKPTLWFLSRAWPVWCLLCLVREKYDHLQLVALVLVPHNTEKQEYRRIGILFINCDSSSSASDAGRFFKSVGDIKFYLDKTKTQSQDVIHII